MTSFQLKTTSLALLTVIGIKCMAQPNVILVMTDDQGYGDIAAHGHPHLITPNMDRLKEMSVGLENFHVDPTCAPTRASLLTGRYSARAGVWHTIMGRNLLREDESTLAEVLNSAGYKTGIFGKWHLGDNYPYSARFRGFDDAVVHNAGGVGQTPDYWGNDYFDDHYNDNGEWRKYNGYCTDVWFGEALRFIRQNKEQPFFLYLPTNAAHQTRPHVPAEYRNLYKDLDEPEALKIFWGMITNIDHNLGLMLDSLVQWNLLDNTILIFMGDNGTCMGPGNWPKERQDEWSTSFNAGMRGNKGSHYEGGHRVFGFLHYPKGSIAGGRKVENIAAHIDIMPTILELCGVPKPDHIRFDGMSLVPLLKGENEHWPDRTLIVHNQRVINPVKWKDTAVMTDRWRLVNNRELYDMQNDPGQMHNAIDDYADVAGQLSLAYNQWWDDVSEKFQEHTPLYIGAPQQNPVQLNAHDWMSDEIPPWNQPMILQRPLINGPWQVRITQPGHYRFSLRERPNIEPYALTAFSARLQIGNQLDITKTVSPGDTEVIFETELIPEDTNIQTWLIEKDGTSRGAYFVEVEGLSKD